MTDAHGLEIALPGCRPAPMASYLKALAVLRIVGAQEDPTARAFWRDDTFHLRSRLDEVRLVEFFLESYRPTPVIAPWNGGSGFYPTGNASAAATIERIESTSHSRFSAYRTTIAIARALLAAGDVEAKPAEGEKSQLVRACRAKLPDEALDWLDAAIVIGADRLRFPPLLGTGGNDGRLDFSINFMQRLLDVLSDGSSSVDEIRSRSWLRGALFGESVDGLTSSAIGQFLPSRAGGVNSATGFEGTSVINPWDFVLTIEGALSFAAAATRRLESNSFGTSSFPFTVRACSVGYPSASSKEESSARAETWVPLWDRAASHIEIMALMAEGRASLGRRSVRDGLDFARAVTDLGVDRGISAFQRFGFQPRNGRSYFAVPLQRLRVSERRSLRMIHEIDPWLDTFRRAAREQNAPAAVGRSCRRLEEALLELCSVDDALRCQEILLALGAAQGDLAARQGWVRMQKRLGPVPPLDPEWLERCDDGSAEYRLAAAIASSRSHLPDDSGTSRLRHLREHFDPVILHRRGGRMKAVWNESAGDPDVVPPTLPLIDRLIAGLDRRLQATSRAGSTSLRLEGQSCVTLGDVVAFIEERVDDGRIDALIRGLQLIDWHRAGTYYPRMPDRQEQEPDAGFGLISLSFSGSRISTPAIPMPRTVFAAARSGRGSETTRLAARRLRASGLTPAIEVVAMAASRARRSAAALTIPLSDFLLGRLAQLYLRTQGEESGKSTESTSSHE